MNWTLEKFLSFGLLITASFGWICYDITEENARLQEKISTLTEQRDFWKDSAQKIAGGREELNLALVALERLNRALRQDIDVIEAHQGKLEDLPED